MTKFKLYELISKLTYSSNSSDEIVQSIVQNTKNNDDLTLIQSKKDNKPLSDKKIEGILRRKAKK